MLALVASAWRPAQGRSWSVGGARRPDELVTAPGKPGTSHPQADDALRPRPATWILPELVEDHLECRGHRLRPQAGGRRDQRMTTTHNATRCPSGTANQPRPASGATPDSPTSTAERRRSLTSSGRWSPRARIAGLG